MQWYLPIITLFKSNTLDSALKLTFARISIKMRSFRFRMHDKNIIDHRYKVVGVGPNNHPQMSEWINCKGGTVIQNVVGFAGQSCFLDRRIYYNSPAIHPIKLAKIIYFLNLWTPYKYPGCFSCMMAITWLKIHLHESFIFSWFKSSYPRYIKSVNPYKSWCGWSTSHLWYPEVPW